MYTIICQTQIIQVGHLAKDFREENMLITFKQGITSELSDYCFILPKDLALNKLLLVGQKITFGQYTYTITAVGSVATENFKQLGHLTVIFDGHHQAKLDGAIHVQGYYPEDLNVGDKFIITEN